MSADARLLVTSANDGTLHLFDAKTGKKQAELKGHRENLRAMAFSPDGKVLASGGFGGGLAGNGKDKSIKLWDVATGESTDTLIGHKKGIYAIVFAPDGKSLIAMDFNGSMIYWNVNPPGIRAALEKIRQGAKLTGTPVGQWAVSTDLKRWAASSGNDLLWLDISIFTTAE